MNGERDAGDRAGDSVTAREDLILLPSIFRPTPRSLFLAHYSSFPVPRTSFPVPRSPYFVPHSFLAPRSSNYQASVIKMESFANRS